MLLFKPEELTSDELNQTNSSEYFNYGFNHLTWAVHVKKFKDKVKEYSEYQFKHIHEQQSENNYLWNLPLELGGLGDYLKNNENLNFIEMRESNIPIIEFNKLIGYYVSLPTEKTHIVTQDELKKLIDDDEEEKEECSINNNYKNFTFNPNINHDIIPNGKSDNNFPNKHSSSQNNSNNISTKIITPVIGIRKNSDNITMSSNRMSKYTNNTKNSVKEPKEDICLVNSKTLNENEKKKRRRSYSSSVSNRKDKRRSSSIKKEKRRDKSSSRIYQGNFCI